MRIRLILFLILIIHSPFLFSNVERGVIDLSNWDFLNNNAVNLSGEWSITYNKDEKSYIHVPGNWDKNLNEVLYSLTIISSGVDNLMLSTSQINSEFIFILNGKKLTSDREIRPLYIPLNLVAGKNILEFKIKNYTDIYSGFRNIPYLGSYNFMLKKYEINILKDTLFTGAAFIMFIFFFILFVNYKKDRSTLYFSLLCLNLSIRSLVTNDKIIFDYIPNLPYWIIIKFEYLTIYMLPILILMFIKYYFNSVYFNKIFNFAKIIGILLPLSTLLLPPQFFIKILIPFYIYTGLSGIYAVMVLLYYRKNKIEDAGKILLAISSLALAALFDIMIILFSFSERLIMTNAMVIFILFMSFIVSRRETKKEKKINILSIDNIKVNDFLSKFVPNEFIKTMGVGDISQIKRGDGVEKSMVVLFSSIKDFQKELKVYKAEETIELLNTTYDIIAPIISENNGFIDKFIDETVMALFPGKVEDAIESVMQIQKKLDIYNNNNISKKPLIMRSGIHVGMQFIGIVGDKNRVDATVISKVVNTASRINDFTSKIDRDILISEDVYIQLEDVEKYNSMYMGSVKLKGKENFIGIYSIDPIIASTADMLFSRAMKTLRTNSREEIERALKRIKYLYPDHAPSIFYLNLMNKNKRLEVLDS